MSWIRSWVESSGKDYEKEKQFQVIDWELTGKLRQNCEKYMGMITAREGKNLNIPENGMAAACQ